MKELLKAILISEVIFVTASIIMFIAHIGILDYKDKFKVIGILQLSLIGVFVIGFLLYPLFEFINNI